MYDLETVCTWLSTWKWLSSNSADSNYRCYSPYEGSAEWQQLASQWDTYLGTHMQVQPHNLSQQTIEKLELQHTQT